MTMLEIALQHAARGWYVFPCKPRDKYPITENGWHDASRDDAKIRAWWTKTPNANVGIACGMSGLAVLDIDTGLDNEESAMKWLAKHESNPSYAVRSGRRPGYGLQVYFTGAIPDVKGWDLDDCKGDIKSLGGYVLAAGCVHPSGETYQPLIEYTQTVRATPDFVRDLKSPNAGTGKDAAPVEGGRNNYLTSVGGKLRNSGLGAEALEMALLQHNADVCVPPLPEDEVRTIAAHVARYDVPERPPEVTIGSKPEPEAPADWRTRYHTFDEMNNAPKPTFLIDGFLQKDVITAIAAPVGQRKTIVACNAVHAVLTGEPLFGHFAVTERAARVLYLCPEMGLLSFADRLRNLGLLPHVGKTLFCRTMNSEGHLTLTDLTAEELEGAVVVIDTAVRFVIGDENSSEDMKVFAASCFGLMKSGAASVIVLFHSPKGTKEASELTLENAMRGSGDLGAFVSSCWATRLQDPDNDGWKSASYMKNVKQRDFKSKPFEVTSNEQGRLVIVAEPGAHVILNSNAKTFTADKDGKEADAVQFIRDNPNMSVRDVVLNLKEMGIKRAKTWVGEKRYEVLRKGVSTKSE